MGDIVLVPIHLDALHLPSGQSVTEARANFDRLPYFDGKRDVYANTVNLSESIVSKPFQNQNLYLKSGIHLHWALPNVLTTGVQGKSSIEFPAAPNRWLIIRRQNNQETGKWIVESDYLHPPENGHQEDSITFPVTYPYKDPSKCKEAPRFCYLGRQLTWSQWLKEKDQPENRYLDQITAIGYGETTFAAFYPNCRSVFGFYDSFDGNFTSAKNVEYDVIGWYGNSGQDYSRNIAENFETSDQFKQFEQDFTDNRILEQIKAEGFLQYLRDTNQTYLLGIVKGKTTPFTAEKDKSYCIQQIRMYLCQGLKASLASKLKWDIRDLKTLDNQMICYARLAFADKLNISHNRQSEKVSLAVGNTGGEALAAYLASIITKDQASQKTIIEEQLALIDLTDSIDSLNSDRPDFGAIFQQRQHQNSFNALTGGFIWEITITKDSNPLESDHNSSSFVGLPQHLMTELNQLNQKQQEYNCHQAVIDSMRYQLFSDWYKYMVSCYPLDTWDNYPDIDEIKSYIETCGLKPLTDKDTKTEQLKGELDGQIKQLAQKIEAYNREVQKNVDNATKITFKLEQVADARYWQPKEPVVLIVEEQDSTNNALKATDRYDRNELLGCTALSDKTIEDLIKENFQPVVDKIDSLSQNLPTEGKPKFWGLKTWSKQPWNPFLLEWLVEFFPVAAPAKSSSLRRYGSNFLTDNYILAEHDFELSPKSNYQVPISAEKQLNHIVTDQDFNTYNGSSILTPYAALALQQKLEELAKKYPAQTTDPIDNPVYTAIALCEQNLDPKDPQNRDRQLEAYIRARIPHNYPDYTKAIKIDKDDFFSDKDNLTNLKKWYETNELQSIPSFSQTVSDAQAQLSKVHCLSQALGGFNAALLMHKQTLQLNIQDPIGFLDYRKFTTKVRRAIANCNAVAPQPLDRFNPVRSGEIKVINLRLIDTFGQIKDLTYPEAVIVPKTLKSEQPERVYLPPRIVQPARINFDWLPAGASSLDSNFTPICGWIVPNNLDHSLFIYSNTGQALGSIEQNGNWMYSPGNLQMELEDIPNPHLKKMVSKLCELGKQEQKNFIKYFEETLNNALENIELEQSAQTNVASLLVGRPIALVRASINLELRGLPAVNQNWQIFRQDMQLERKNESSGDRRNSQTERETDGFTEINVPIRVGEYQQFNDGVLGYWKETPIETEKGQDYVYEHDIFYAQQSDTVESAHIETQYWDTGVNSEINDQVSGKTLDAQINVIQTLDGAAQTITMLVDPYHSVHVSAGILPTKVVSIPPEQYVPIIQAIQVAFLTSPLLSDRDSYNFPLPKIPQHSWTWLEKQQDQWDRVYDFPAIDKAAFLTSYPEDYWQLLIEADWLTEIPGQPIKAAITDPKNRPKNSDDDQVKPLIGLLEGLEQEIDLFFALYQVDLIPATIQANFTQTQQIREGWLVLKKVKDR